MGDPTDPRSTGRVWTDKSVSTESVTLKTYDGKDVTVAPEEGSFLVGLSAMSSAQKLVGVSNVTKPLDIVLVLDTSGSMNFNMAGESVLGYERIYSNSSNFSTNKTYYIKDGSEYYEVYYDSSFGWYYWKGENWYTVTPKSSAQDWQNTQFYEGIPIPEADRRMTALKQAVNGFIDETITANSKVSDANKKNRIGLVTYASENNTSTRSGLTDSLTSLKTTVDNRLFSS